MKMALWGLDVCKRQVSPMQKQGKQKGKSKPTDKNDALGPKRSLITIHEVYTIAGQCEFTS
jgi:hypothetical protein